MRLFGILLIFVLFITACTTPLTECVNDDFCSEIERLYDCSDCRAQKHAQLPSVANEQPADVIEELESLVPPKNLPPDEVITAPLASLPAVPLAPSPSLQNSQGTIQTPFIVDFIKPTVGSLTFNRAVNDTYVLSASGMVVSLEFNKSIPFFFNRKIYNITYLGINSANELTINVDGDEQTIAIDDKGQVGPFTMVPRQTYSVYGVQFADVYVSIRTPLYMGDKVTATYFAQSGSVNVSFLRTDDTQELFLVSTIRSGIYNITTIHNNVVGFSSDFDGSLGKKIAWTSGNNVILIETASDIAKETMLELITGYLEKFPSDVQYPTQESLHVQTAQTFVPRTSRVSRVTIHRDDLQGSYLQYYASYSGANMNPSVTIAYPVFEFTIDDVYALQKNIRGEEQYETLDVFGHDVLYTRHSDVGASYRIYLWKSQEAVVRVEFFPAFIQADDLDLIAELLKKFPQNPNVKIGPDLFAFSGEANVLGDQQLYAKVRVCQVGNESLKSGFNVSFIVDAVSASAQNGVYKNANSLRFTADQINNQPNKCISPEFTWQNVGQITSGNITMRVDSLGEITETNEFNNVLIKTISTITQ
jgi:hypothetical protein